MNYGLRNHCQSIIRSITLGQNNWIYAGEQDDFGYFPQKKQFIHRHLGTRTDGKRYLLQVEGKHFRTGRGNRAPSHLPVLSIR